MRPPLRLTAATGSSCLTAMGPDPRSGLPIRPTSLTDSSPPSPSRTTGSRSLSRGRPL
ncbi:hypothetical protein LINPERPRIM_LOCUS17711 [Linum perenne]